MLTCVPKYVCFQEDNHSRRQSKQNDLIISTSGFYELIIEAIFWNTRKHVIFNSTISALQEVGAV